MARTPPEPPQTPRAYKVFTPRMGVYAVRHLPSGRVLIGPSPHVEGRLNRERFQLQMGMHVDKALQADWNRDGAQAFSFEVLDDLAPDPSRPPTHDYVDDLNALAELWRERLALTAQNSD